MWIKVRQVGLGLPGDLWSQSEWDSGLRRVVRRRWQLVWSTGTLAALLSGWVFATALYSPWVGWLPIAMTGAIVFALALVILALYEQAQSDELIGRWIHSLRAAHGGRLRSAAALCWATRIEEILQERRGLAMWLVRPLFQEGLEQLLQLAVERAKAEVGSAPLDWGGHVQLARGLAQLVGHLPKGEERCGRLHRQCLDELSIARQLAPEEPDVYGAMVSCALRLEEPEVELNGRERLIRLCPEAEHIVAYGRALLQQGYAGLLFSLYLEVVEEDPITARELLAVYQEPQEPEDPF